MNEDTPAFRPRIVPDSDQTFRIGRIIREIEERRREKFKAEEGVSEFKEFIAQPNENETEQVVQSTDARRRRGIPQIKKAASLHALRQRSDRYTVAGYSIEAA